MAPKPRKQVSPPKETKDARDYKASKHGSKRGMRQQQESSEDEGDIGSVDVRPDIMSQLPETVSRAQQYTPMKQNSEKQSIKQLSRHKESDLKSKKRSVLDPQEQALLAEKKDLQKNADALMAQLSQSRAIGAGQMSRQLASGTDSRIYSDFNDTIAKANSKKTKLSKVAQNRYNPILQTMQSDALSSRDGGYSKAAVHLMESNPYRPKTPLKESIDKLRGQIQALQKLQSIHVQDPITHG